MGAAHQPLQRLYGFHFPDNGDGYSMNYTDRPECCNIEKMIIAPWDQPNLQRVNLLFVFFGQFAASHDLGLTPANKKEQYSGIICGNALNRLKTVPSKKGRKNVNEVTSWLDLSQVYGSSKKKAKALREGKGGRLQESRPGFPPTNCEELGVKMEPGTQGRNSDFCVGDERGNENNYLLSYHIIFLRNHNYYADRCSRRHPFWSDEKCFQWARARNIAEYQSIYFYEWLPLYLGHKYFWEESGMWKYKGYDSSLNAATSVEFTQAILRISRSLIAQKAPYTLFDRNLRSFQTRFLDLKQVLFSPGSLVGFGSVEAWLNGAREYPAQEVGPRLARDIITISEPFLPNLHLGAVDCARGRDTGLIDYMSLRKRLGLPAKSLKDVTKAAHNSAVLGLYEKLDPSLENIDLWVGAMLEDHTEDGLVGYVGRHVIAAEMKRLRDGDRFWFESRHNKMLSRREKRRFLYSASIARVINRVTDLKFGARVSAFQIRQV